MKFPQNFEHPPQGRPLPGTVCFDFFDTLIYRSVSPEYTKKLACHRLGILLDSKIPGETLYEIRRDLEADLCGRNQQNGLDLDFHFFDLAEAFYRHLREEKKAGLVNFSSDEFCDRLKHIEIEVEKQVQHLYPDVAEFVKGLRKNGSKIYLVSDFYLPRALIEELLVHHGIRDLFDDIFVSADFGLTKASGRIYDAILKTLGCAPESIIMIGDNSHSDVAMPQTKGMGAIHVDRRKQHQFYRKWSRKQRKASQQPKIPGRMMRALIRKHGGRLFAEMGAILWKFTHDLFLKLQQDKIKSIFFFSKEGEFLKRLFDHFQQTLLGYHPIQSHYLIVSRKSTYIASLGPLAEGTFDQMFLQYRNVSPREFLLSLNFDRSTAKEICAAVELDFDRRCTQFPTTAAFRKIISADKFKQAYEEKRLSQKRNLLAYLDSFGVDFNKEGLNIVDVGWKGSIQNNLHLAMGGEITARGYYIGLLNPSKLGPKNRKTGILFTNSPDRNPYYNVYNNNRSLFEMLLGASHGSAEGYVTENRGGANKRPRNVKTLHSVIDGKKEIAILTLDLPQERQLFESKIRPIQKKMFTLTAAMTRMVCSAKGAVPASTWFARQHGRMVFRPSSAEVDFYLKLYHLENFGIFEYTTFNRQIKIGLKQRLNNLRLVVNNSYPILETGFWPPVILKELGIGFYRHIDGRRRFKREFGEVQKEGLKIAFLLGTPDICGGTYVVFQHAAYLMRHGYRVAIITPEPVHPDRYAWHPEAESFEWLTHDSARQIKFDYAVATWWRSVLFLKSVNADSYLYFVQSIESRFFPPEEPARYEDNATRRLCENTYLLALPVITEARWIQKYLQDNYSRNAYLVSNGIRKELYRETGDSHASRTPGKLRLLIEGDIDVDFKNVRRTIALCLASEADEIWLLTLSAITEYPGVERVFSRVPIWETPPIYRSCDVLVKLSYVEGMFGPPLEMFHCGGTSIVYDVSGHDEYIKDGFNSLVVRTNDEKGVVESINRLKQNPELLQRLKQGARKTAHDWPSWNHASKRFHQVLKTLKGNTLPNLAYLTKFADHLLFSESNEIKAFGRGPSVWDDTSMVPCFQLYWHSGEGFREDNSVKIDYKSGRWVRLSEIITLHRSSVQLRIDPCMQRGVIRVQHIRIYDATTRRLIMGFDQQSGWDSIEVAGTAAVLSKNETLIIESKDQDPQILLPPSNAALSEPESPDPKTPGRISPDLTLEFEVKLKFLSFRQTVRELIA